MKKIIKIDTWIGFLAVICAAMLLLSVSCIKEDRDDCEYESLIYIVVETESPYFDATLNGATIYLFDSDGVYYSSIQVSADDIAANVPIPISYDRDDLPWAVVWGNVDAGEHFIMPTTVQTMENMFVSMVSGADGYTLPADNLFYGMKRLSGEPVERVVITPKTGMISITVRGLREDPAYRYYFTVESPYDHYDFHGTPIAGEVLMNLPGVYNGTDIATAQPYNLFHFPENVTNEEYVTVKFYRMREDSGEEELLATVMSDIDGEPIVIEREKTTNILIYFLTGDLRVNVVVTEWGRIHQWDYW